MKTPVLESRFNKFANKNKRKIYFLYGPLKDF